MSILQKLKSLLTGRLSGVADYPSLDIAERVLWGEASYLDWGPVCETVVTHWPEALYISSHGECVRVAGMRRPLGLGEAAWFYEDAAALEAWDAVDMDQSAVGEHVTLGVVFLLMERDRLTVASMDRHLVDDIVDAVQYARHARVNR